MWRRVAVGLLLGVASKGGQATIISESLSHPGLSIQQKGHWYRLKLGQLAPGNQGSVTTLSWQIRSLQVWPQAPSVLLCRSGDCQRLDSVAGVSRGFAGKGSGGEWSIAIALSGSGPLQPPVRVTGVSLTVDRTVLPR